jgi:hypothetical protein
LDFVEHVAKETAEEVTGVFEHARLGALDVAIDLAEAGSEHTHVAVEELTGDALRKAEDAAKKAGNIQGPNSKNDPYVPWYSRY